jgi:hypothetical protein
MGYQNVEPTSHKTATQSIKYGIKIPNKIPEQDDPDYKPMETEQEKKRREDEAGNMNE